MIRFGKVKNIAFGVVAALAATVGLSSFDVPSFSELGDGGAASAQEGGRNGGRGGRGQGQGQAQGQGAGGQRFNGGQGFNRGGQGQGNNGGQGFNRGGQGQGNNGGRGFNRGGQGQGQGNNGGDANGNRRNGRTGPGNGNGNWTPDQIARDMTAERFENLKNGPFADRIKSMVGEERWTRWENGNFSNAADDAAKAQAAAEGRLEEITSDLTDEERLEAEARLRSGTVPEFNEEGVPHYSIETEADYYRQAMARRDDILVDAVPIALRYYARYIKSKYDKNGDGILQRSEWENNLEGAQAIDLNGDWDITDQELLYYLVRFAKDRTIFNPVPRRENAQRTNFLTAPDDGAEFETLIRPASAAPKRLSGAEAREAQLNNDGNGMLADMTDEDVRELLLEGNPALESVEDEELLDAFLTDVDESTKREFTVSPAVVRGTPGWFLANDKDGDGQLTILEFAPGLSQKNLALFGKYDVDGDQIITAEEARKASAQ